MLLFSLGVSVIGSGPFSTDLFFLAFLGELGGLAPLRCRRLRFTLIPLGFVQHITGVLRTC